MAPHPGKRQASSVKRQDRLVWDLAEHLSPVARCPIAVQREGPTRNFEFAAFPDIKRPQ